MRLCDNAYITKGSVQEKIGKSYLGAWVQMDFWLLQKDILTWLGSEESNKHRQGLRHSKTHINDVYEILRPSLPWLRKSTYSQGDPCVIDSLRSNLPGQPELLELLSKLSKPGIFSIGPRLNNTCDVGLKYARKHIANLGCRVEAGRVISQARKMKHIGGYSSQGGVRPKYTISASSASQSS